MPDIPVLLAVSAGMVAALNPCGFALLPTYLTLVVAGGDPGQSRAAAVRRALLMTGAMTVGFVAVFGAFGLLVVPLALSLQEYLPWVTIVIGFALVGLGVFLVTGRELLLTTPKLGGTAPGRTARSMVLYGVGYAVASLSCTIGPFLAIATTTFRSGSVPAGVAVFVLYAVGMGITVGVLAVAVALARTGLVARFRQALPYVGRVSGGLLVLAGLYVAYYGWYELRVFAGGDPNDPVVGAVTAVQGEVAQFVAGVNPWVAVAVLGGLVLIGAAGARRRRGASATAETIEERTMVG